VSKNALIGATGVYYVASELSRRGLIALPTIRNTKGYDIIVANMAGTGHANIDVKASLKCVDFFPAPPSDRVCTGPNDYYVLVRWLEKDRRFEAFMLTGAEAKEEVIWYERERQVEGKSPFAGIHVGKWAKGRDALWKERWKTWNL